MHLTLVEETDGDDVPGVTDFMGLNVNLKAIKISLNQVQNK